MYAKIFWVVGNVVKVIFSKGSRKGKGSIFIQTHKHSQKKCFLHQTSDSRTIHKIYHPDMTSYFLHA